MNKVKIGNIQMFYIMVGYVLGTAIILGLGLKVKQDAWIFILIGTLGGMFLMTIYTKLSAFYPNDSLVQMMPKIIGKFLSYPIIFLYIFHFTYSAARACRELGDLLASTILVETPQIVIIGSFMVLIIYCLRGGIEPFFRMGEVVFPVYIFALILIWILLLSVKGNDVTNLTPILANGVNPVLKEAVPAAINFPFGETIVFMMFFPFLNDKYKLKKIGIFAVLFGGILLTVNSIMIILVLGPEIYSQNIFAFLTATRMVSIADFLERFDVLVILMMVAGVFFKTGGFMFGAAIGIANVFNLKQTRSVILGLGTIITSLSLLSATSYMEHLNIGSMFFVPYVHTFLQIIVPILLLCIAFIRKRFN
ncbi:spore gernimation protein KB [Bacillus sp. SA1-12]|uniref:GerAB/ArcD/ProY family transporter n=1 Tax=Bacillus sp. SA1-12 TaxID=1455638 RepID=UPI00062541CC|nr:endospore germination permease [Bacillus sp. SA1-12]KKI92423.1 spore gernimation protein KB [Bacillus sp. SA1-12]